MDYFSFKSFILALDYYDLRIIIIKHVSKVLEQYEFIPSKLTFLSLSVHYSNNRMEKVGYHAMK